jgi:hypothetical protein
MGFDPEKALGVTLYNAARGAGTTAIQAAVTGQKIRVLSLLVVRTAGANAIDFQSDSTSMTDDIYGTSTVPFVLPYSPLGWFETAAGEGLNAVVGSGTTCRITLAYVMI